MKNKFNKITPEMARIHAHICGDGCAYTKKEKYSKKQLLRHPRKNLYEKVWLIEYTNTCQELLEEFYEDILIAFNRKGQRVPKYHRISLHSTKWILEYLELIGKNSYNWYIPKKIINSNEKVICAWLRAFFDDESTVSVSKKMIRIKSMNPAGLGQVQDLLARLTIYSKITGQNCDKSYYLNIYRTDIKKYASLIGFTHPDKINKIEKVAPR